VFADDGALRAYDVTAGGGLGRAHGKTTTYPRLADELGSVAPDRLLEALRAIVLVQREYGDRSDRRHARLKYLIADRGLTWFRAEVERVAGFALDAWLELPPWEDAPRFGWHAQGDNRWFLGLHVASGRVRDDGPMRLKTALRALADHGFDLVATPGQLACPAMPTCGLALAEAERVVPGMLDAIEAELASAGLAGEPITIRMTGCPNGCARPYLAEIGIVGQTADRYQIYLGGAPASTRLATPWRDDVRSAEIAPLLAPLFTAYAGRRRPGEPFGDWCARDVVWAVPA
jgi:sulfite reductase (ferredoxin)